MAQDLIAAAGSRLEALLRAQETRARSLRSTATLQPSPVVPFVLPDGTNQFPYEPTGHVDSNVPNVTPPVSAESGVGATFRRRGVLSDVPMTVTRVGDGVVFTTFTDSDGAHEMTFAAEQIELVTKAPASLMMDAAPLYQIPLAAVDAAPTAVAPSAAAAATAATTTSAALPAASYSPPIFDPAPIPFVLLPDGTKQFGYAPSGATNINLVPNVTPPVPAEFGIGATFRRHGVTPDIPMTVTRIGDGVVFANFTAPDGITYDAAFHPSQLDLVTAAP